jgi:Tfp pilus assembly protein PilV
MKKKLKAATLLESLIAMVILVVCFGIATMIYSNVLNSDKQRLKLKAILLLKIETFAIKKNKTFIDSEKTEGEFTLKQTFEREEGTDNLFHMKLLACDKDGNHLAVHNELLAIEK